MDFLFFCGRPTFSTVCGAVFIYSPLNNSEWINLAKNLNSYVKTVDISCFWWSGVFYIPNFPV